MEVTKLSQEQRDELRWTLYYSSMDGEYICVDPTPEQEKELIAAEWPSEISDGLINELYAGIDFSTDDFFCTAGKVETA